MKDTKILKGPIGLLVICLALSMALSIFRIFKTGESNSILLMPFFVIALSYPPYVMLLSIFGMKKFKNEAVIGWAVAIPFGILSILSSFFVSTVGLPS
jgi:hypothetical protein